VDPDVNVAGLVVLLGLLVTKLTQLVRDWRGHVIGSRLKARMVWTFGVLATLPILLVYFFAVQFLTRASTAGSTSRCARASTTRWCCRARRSRRACASTSQPPSSSRTSWQRWAASRPGCSRPCAAGAGALEITIATESGAIIAVSKGPVVRVVPDEVRVRCCCRCGRAGRSSAWSRRPGRIPGAYRRAARQCRRSARPPGRAGALPGGGADRCPGDTLQETYQQFGEKDYLRRPLKASFILTLTVVLLLSLLAAWYGAIFTAQRLVQPIQDLVKGTRAVAQGDLDTRLPLTSHDEMGFLVHSFNDMTKRLRLAREDQQRAQQAAETERANLAIILARLSTGVISLEPDLRLRTANRAAITILGDELEGSVGRDLGEIGDEEGLLGSSARLAARASRGRSGVARAVHLPGRHGAPHPHVRLHAAAR